METIRIRMLGEFSLRCGEKQISDQDNRTKKVWSLLSYLICHRGRVVPVQKLIELLWGEDPSSNNPENALRITFHRTRSLLDNLWPGAGRDLICYKDGGYTWNLEIPLCLDCDRFEELCRTEPDDQEEKLRDRLEALELYKGDFLQKQSSEVWVIPISTHFHNMYVQVVLETAKLLSAQDQHGEAAKICRAAIVGEPYHEVLHQVLMQELVAAGDSKAATAVYETLSKRLFDDFGIRPSAETRTVYREAVHTPGENLLPMEEILEDLHEQDPQPGALQCDYDYFKILCYVMSRDMERSGNVAHVALLSVSPQADAPLTKHSVQRIMDQLGQQLHDSLRRGDTFSRCSTTQYIAILPKANYENSCMVCRRVIGAFQRAHPHVAAKIQYMVQPLTVEFSAP